MIQEKLSSEELLAKCRSNEPITRNDARTTPSTSKDGTVYLKENEDFGTRFWKFSKDSTDEKDK